MRFPTWRILIVAVLAAPLAAWVGFRPVRVFAPELAGVHCPIAEVCVDVLSRLPEAALLRVQAVQFVEAKVGPLEHAPRVIFCSAEACAKSFGFTGNASYNVGTYALVIAPRGWKPYFLRHELIHHLQNERLGSNHVWLFTPTWFIEGMAYSLSEDPRRPLMEPWEGYRSRFEAWYENVGASQLWSAAAVL